MHCLREVDRESLVNAWSEGFAANNNAPTEIAPLQARIDEFNALFSDVNEGQTIEFDYLPDTGTEQRKGTVAGEDFRENQA
jgi:chalcone isomerase-like protein